MTAKVFAFPERPIDEARLALANCPFNEPIELNSKDAELAHLIGLADRLVGNIVEYDVDCFLVRFDQYDARQA